MGTRKRSLIRAAAVPLAVAACNGGAGSATPASRGASLEELVRAERAFAALAADSTVQHAFESYIAGDGVLFRPGPVDGPSALAAQPMAADLALLWEPAWADISVAGDLGYTTGPWRAGQRGVSPDSMTAAGEYVTVWRRTPDGFRFELDFGIRHDPVDAEWPADVRFATLVAAPEGETEAGPQQAHDALLIADQDLADALLDGDPATWRAYAAEDVRVLRNGTAPAFGADALIAASPAVPIRYQPANAFVAASNDLGYTFGAARVAGNADADPMGYYLRIWRRQADGSWKLALDLTDFPPG